MNSAVDRAISEWEKEVDDEMVQLIEEGWSPYEAALKSKEIVQRRRYQAKWKAKRDALCTDLGKVMRGIIR